MEYIQKLPFFLGASMAIIIGVINSIMGTETKTIYIRMSVGLVLFFILGLYIRGFIYKLYEEIKEKGEDEQNIKEEQEAKNNKEVAKPNVDYRVDDDSFETDINIEKDETLYEEEFTPLNVNSIKLNKENSK